MIRHSTARFQDRFVRQVFTTFGEETSVGRDHAAKVLESAYKFKLLNVARLDRSSLILVALCCTNSSAFRRAVWREFQVRRANPREDGEALADVPPRRCAEVLGIALNGDREQRKLVFEMLRVNHLLDLMEFLDRTELTDRNFIRAENLLWEAFDSLDDARFVEFDADFAAYLYHFVLDAGDVVPRDAWPSPRPAWAATLGVEERAFVNACLRLETGQRLSAYTCFYAGLSVRQIHLALRGDQAELPLEKMVDQIQAVWFQILQSMAQVLAAVRGLS